MNIIFVTMGAMYKPYFDTYKSLENNIDKIGFYVSDKFYFEKNKQSDDKIQYLKEWDLTEQLDTIKLDKQLVEKFEKKYFTDESFWNALNNDRRVFLGKYAKYTQDYEPSYEYEDMLKLFQIFTNHIEAFIESINPDIIVGMGQGTVGDYLFYKIAKAKGIKYYTLKSVKTANYQTLTDTISEEHYSIKKSFNEYLDGKSIEPEIYEKANKYIINVNKGLTAYEGNVAISNNYPVFKINYIINFTKYLIKDILTLSKNRDQHNKSLFSLTYLYNNSIKNYRAKQFKKFTKTRTVFELDKLENGNYIFFPLHAEPEIALTNYARYYQNQIEVIRNIAFQLPSKYKLIVKEHPRNIGRRSLGYYKKILDIPNVDFVDFELPSIEVVKRSKLVIVLSGNIGFEAVLHGIPVVSFGNTMYNMLPKTMVNHLDSIKNLYLEIKQTISNYNYSKNVIEKYISAIIKNSFPLDVYTILLRKPGREGGSEFDNMKYKLNIKELSKEILKKIEEVKK